VVADDLAAGSLAGVVIMIFTPQALALAAFVTSVVSGSSGS